MTKQQKAAIAEAMKVSPNGLTLRQLLAAGGPHADGMAPLVSTMQAEGRRTVDPPKVEKK